MALFIQQPSELPQPEPASPDQRFGEYTFQYFVEDNFWYILITLFIVLVLFLYSWNASRKKRKKIDQNVDNARER